MKKWILFLFVVCFAGGHIFSSCTTQKPQPVGPVTFDWDKASVSSIEAEIAQYPAEYKDTYNKIVKVKCALCHPIARVLWAPYYDDATWAKIVNKMATRPGSNVTSDEAPKILKFAEYDHQKRQAEIEKQFQDQHWEHKPPVALQ